MTEQNTESKMVPRGHSILLARCLGISHTSRVPQVTKQEVYEFLDRQGVTIPKPIREHLDTILSIIEDSNTPSWASYCEARRQVGTYLETRDDIEPVKGRKSRAVKFYDLLNAWEMAK